MTDDLFFVPIIAEAMKQPDRNAALRTAFRQIEEMGRQPRYRQGLQQFRRFMEIAGEACTIVFVVERDGKHVGEVSIGPAVTSGAMAGIVPGRYTVRTSTGRLIWEGPISEDEVVWSRAFKGEPLPLAAATEDTPRRCSRKESLMNGEVVLRIHPGVEAGEITFDLLRGQ